VLLLPLPEYEFFTVVDDTVILNVYIIYPSFYQDYLRLVLQNLS